MMKLVVVAALLCAVSASGILPVVPVTAPLGVVSTAVGVPVGGVLAARVGYGGVAYDGVDNLGLAYTNRDGPLGGYGYGPLGLGYGGIGLGYGRLGLRYGRLGLGYGRLGLGYGGLGYLLRR